MTHDDDPKARVISLHSGGPGCGPSIYCCSGAISRCHNWYSQTPAKDRLNTCQRPILIAHKIRSIGVNISSTSYGYVDSDATTPNRTRRPIIGRVPAPSFF